MPTWALPAQTSDRSWMQRLFLLKTELDEAAGETGSLLQGVVWWLKGAGTVRGHGGRPVHFR